MERKAGDRSNFMLHLFYIFIPFCLWLFIFRDILFGKILFGADTMQYYHWVSYFLNNIQHGVFPLWNPYQAWGCIDNFDMRIVGDYNPLLYMIAILRTVGISGAASFFTFLIVYFWIGTIGFYVLANKIFKNAHIAFAAYVMLMFSGFGMHFFVFQFVDVLIFTPIIWFFYFLLSFCEKPKAKTLAGITVTLMLMVTTYIPVAFLINIAIGIFFICIFCWKRIMPVVKNSLSFFLRHKWITVLCIVQLAASTVPIIVWKVTSADPQYVIDLGRRPGSSQDVVETSQSAVDAASIPTMTTIEELFDNLDITNDQIMPFVSIFLYAALVWTMFTAMDVPSYIFLCSFVVLLMMSCGSVFSVQPWFFQHVKIFQMFRNYLFFFPELIALGILFLMGRLKSLYESKPTGRLGKCLLSIWGVLGFAGIILFLRQFDHIILSSYLTVLLTLMVFMIWVWIDKVSPKWFYGFIAVIALIQPLQFFHFRMPSLNDSVKPQPIVKAEFSFSRPKKGQGINEEHAYHYRYKILKDNSGYAKLGFYGVKYVQDLQENIPDEYLVDYIQNKFYLYNNWRAAPQDKEAWEDLKHIFADEKAPALIFGDSVPICKIPVDSDRIIVTENSDILRVDRFTVNHISMTVDLPQQMLLIYNDAFHKDWRCYVDGQHVDILRANYAFKGILLNGGNHKVELIFGRPAAHIFPWTLLLTIMAFWIFTIFLFMKDKDEESI